MFVAVFDVTGWLMHINFVSQHTIEIGRSYVHLMNFVVVQCGECEQDSDQIELNYWCERFFIVNPLFLGITLRYEPRFELLDDTI